MSKKLEIIFILLVLCVSVDAKNFQNFEFVPNEFIIKLSPDTKIITPNSSFTGIIEIDDILSKMAIDDISPVVPYKKNLDPRLPDINRIYRIRYSVNISPDKVAEQFNNLDNVIYSEPRYIQYETTVPNDPYYSNQWHLPVIDASQAWNTTTGDTSVIIAIVDDAVDLDHEDLADNIFTNWVEYHGTDGVDDDFNGYVDDIHGWDFAENNNDPNPVIDNQDHGTHVSGCASAVTNNGIGVAAPGWKCKILPLKFSNDNSGSLSGDAAAAIIYAADMGAALTNNSYGGGGFSNYFLDAFHYAYELGTLSITSAGNSDENELFYPAGYNSVFSVASTASGDYKSGFSTYHLSVDISSPGSGILSAYPNNDYASASGTSMASPVAAGVAGLIKSQFPDLTANELAVRLSATADNIYDINSEYYLLLGSGRVNANNAVTYTNNQFNTIPVRMALANFSASDLLHGNGDSSFDPGETIDMDISLNNYSIMGSENVNVYLTSADSRINIIEGTILNLNVPPEDTIILDQAFSFSINDSVNVGICVFNIAIQQGGQNLNSFELSINIGKTPILIVDDDNGGSTDKFYTTILDSMNIPYSLWDRMNGPLSYEMVQNSPILIWFTEWVFPSLDFDDRLVLTEYL
ncbi:MAG: S8 family serine peptidase, partial [Candidatus Neomarinimicrobiota bacterium]|nr:S8 family serine peptidase [Candidatus Neomarinimicrobiota bacterium]